MWQWDDKREIIVDSICAQPEEFCALLDAIDSPWIVGCLDIGHSALVGVEPRGTLSAHSGSKRLQALHVHDVTTGQGLSHNAPSSSASTGKTR